MNRKIPHPGETEERQLLASRARMVKEGKVCELIRQAFGEHPEVGIPPEGQSLREFWEREPRGDTRAYVACSTLEPRLLLTALVEMSWELLGHLDPAELPLQRHLVDILWRRGPETENVRELGESAARIVNAFRSGGSGPMWKSSAFCLVEADSKAVGSLLVGDDLLARQLASSGFEYLCKGLIAFDIESRGLSLKHAADRVHTRLSELFRAHVRAENLGEPVFRNWITGSSEAN